MSWESLLDCDCYRFAITPGIQRIYTKINHDYKLNVRIKTPKGKTVDNLKFEKSIIMDTVVEHELTDWAAVWTGSLEDFQYGQMPPSFEQWTIDLIPWAQVSGFHGDVNALSNVILNKNELLTRALLDSKWDGTLDEIADTRKANVDFANMSIEAYHNGASVLETTANTSSAYPIGWAEVAVGDGGGFAVRWIDYVGFWEHKVKTQSKWMGEVLLGNLSLTKETTPVNTELTYNVFGSPVAYGGDVKSGSIYWQQQLPYIDPDWDGWHLGWSHWIMWSHVPSDWYWLRDVVMTIVEGAEEISIGPFINHIGTNGSWLGSIASAKTDFADDIYILGSWNTGEGDKKIILLENNIEIGVPENMTDLPCYPICPL